MKIYFGIGYPPEPVKLAQNWDEIKASNLVSPTYKQYQIFKLLEKNKPFWNEIIKSRKRLGIPDSGLSWNYARSFEFISEYRSKELDDYIDKLGHKIFSDRLNEQNRLRRLFNFHPYVEAELDDLLVSNYVFTYPMDSISWGSSEYDEDKDETIDDVSLIENPHDITIFITEKITKTQLINYIKKYWNEIDKLNQKLPDPDRYSFSKKDNRIFALKEVDRLTFAQIADKITEEFDNDNAEGTINEDSVKTSYHRTLRKIESVAYLRKRNKKFT